MSRPRFLMLDEPSLGIMPRIVDSILNVTRAELDPAPSRRGDCRCTRLQDATIPAPRDFSSHSRID